MNEPTPKGAPAPVPVAGDQVMRDDGAYFARYFYDTEELCRRASLAPPRLTHWIETLAFPQPSYVITATHQVDSVAFGRLTARSERRLFAKSLLRLLLRIEALAATGTAVRQTLEAELGEALQQVIGAAEASRLGLDFATILANHQQGIYGVCVIDASDFTMIARKELLQAQLDRVHAHGAGALGLTDAALARMIDEYDAIVMPFSSLEYPQSSRCKALELRARLKG